VVSAQCPNRAASALRTEGAEQTRRPKEHDVGTLVTSGYLERLGFQYRPATAASTFRHPHKIEAALRQREARGAAPRMTDGRYAAAQRLASSS
jgi:hypothetical protein